MYTVELYARVRRAVVVDKMSEREAAKEFGLARETVRKMLRYSVPPGYRRQQPARRPKLDAWVGAIDQILENDKTRGKKQRHTAKRIFERLRDEHAYTGGYTIVKDYVRLRKLSQREMFVPLEHPPGDAQADFGEAMVVIGGVERKTHYLAVDLPQSDDCVKGGVKLDHQGGGKVDQSARDWGFGLRDLRGRLERRPAAPVGRRVYAGAEAGPANRRRKPAGLARSVAFRDAVACCLSTGNSRRSSLGYGRDA